MAYKTVDFRQIYFKDTHLGELYPFCKPYRNDTLTPFFENSIIADLVPQSKADVIAICSWQLRLKMRTGVPPRVDLTEEMFQTDFDVLSFTKNTSSHDSLAFMEAKHPGSKALLQRIWAALGRKMPGFASNPIYQNHFAATRQVYTDYVQGFLIPAMEVMENDPEIRDLCWADSQYAVSILGIPVDFDRIERLLGVRYVPMHPFLLERCFSLWLEGRNLNIKYAGL